MKTFNFTNKWLLLNTLEIQCILYRHQHRYVMLQERISLTLSRHLSLASIASGGSSRLYPVSVRGCCRSVLVGCPTLAGSCEGVHERTSLMTSSLLLQQCPAYLVRLIWMFLRWEVGKRAAAILWVVASWVCLIYLVEFTCNSCLAFSLYALSASMWGVSLEELTRPMQGKN